jgi:4-hydroxybenzoate polyprenyltransferase
LLFTIAQVVIGLILVVLLLPFQCLYHSIPSILGTGLYPYGKRFTHYPQIILGCVFSWGVVMAFPALDIDLSGNDQARDAATCLFLSCVAWTMVYDTIYAAQDRKDDAKIGIMSPVVRHNDKTRRLIMGVASTQAALLCLTGIFMEASAVYFLCTCLGGSLTLRAMVGKVNLSDPKDCLWWFKNGCLYTGVLIVSGFLGEYCLRRLSV